MKKSYSFSYQVRKIFLFKLDLEVFHLYNLQIKTLNHKLEEYRMEHKKEEEDLEDEIASMEDRLADVKSDLESRMRDLEITFDFFRRILLDAMSLSANKVAQQ